MRMWRKIKVVLGFGRPPTAEPRKAPTRCGTPYIMMGAKVIRTDEGTVLKRPDSAAERF